MQPDEDKTLHMEGGMNNEWTQKLCKSKCWDWYSIFIMYNLHKQQQILLLTKSLCMVVLSYNSDAPKLEKLINPSGRLIHRKN